MKHIRSFGRYNGKLFCCSIIYHPRNLLNRTVVWSLIQSNIFSLFSISNKKAFIRLSRLFKSIKEDYLQPLLRELSYFLYFNRCIITFTNKWQTEYFTQFACTLKNLLSVVSLPLEILLLAFFRTFWLVNSQKLAITSSPLCQKGICWKTLP